MVVRSMIRIVEIHTGNRTEGNNEESGIKNTEQEEWVIEEWLVI